MTSKALKELESRISDHFYNEARIMKDILESGLTDEEAKALSQFMLAHPFSELSRYVQAVHKKNNLARQHDLCFFSISLAIFNAFSFSIGYSLVLFAISFNA